MFDNTRRNRKVLAGIVGVNLALALAVSAGAVTLPGANDGSRSARTVASAAVVEEPLAPVRQPGDGVSAAMSAPTPPSVPPASRPLPAPGPAPAATQAVVASRPVTDPPGVKVGTPGPVAVTVPNVSLPKVTVPPVATQAARRNPSTAEVQQALSSLPNYVRSILKPSPAQVAQLGDKVCGMFDAGQTYSQVKATGLQMVTQVPLTTVLPGGAEWVVRTVVTMYCPGYLTKLV